MMSSLLKDPLQNTFKQHAMCNDWQLADHLTDDSLPWQVDLVEALLTNDALIMQMQVKDI